MKTVPLTIPLELYKYVQQEFPADKREQFWHLCCYRSKVNQAALAAVVVSAVALMLGFGEVLLLLVWDGALWLLAGTTLIWMVVVYATARVQRRRERQCQRILGHDEAVWVTIGAPTIVIWRRYRKGDPVHTFEVTLPDD